MKRGSVTEFVTGKSEKVKKRNRKRNRRKARIHAGFGMVLLCNVIMLKEKYIIKGLQSVTDALAELLFAVSTRIYFKINVTYNIPLKSRTYAKKLVTLENNFNIRSGVDT